MTELVGHEPLVQLRPLEPDVAPGGIALEAPEAGDPEQPGRHPDTHAGDPDGLRVEREWVKALLRSPQGLDFGLRSQTSIVTAAEGRALTPPRFVELRGAAAWWWQPPPSCPPPCDPRASVRVRAPGNRAVRLGHVSDSSPYPQIPIQPRGYPGQGPDTHRDREVRTGRPAPCRTLALG